ncbi:MAG: GMC family oxidoreductase [Alteromonadaceae bacterium]|nr:MAG: GMC family oxidoreductase [Alteromonadaceae bacterium]
MVDNHKGFVEHKETKEVFDVIVVGSGITGGWAAKEFCEKGFKTLMVERGRFVEHRKDYIGEGVATWDFKHRTIPSNKIVEQQYKIQQHCYAFTDATKHFFGNDAELPYTTEKDSDFRWIRANQLGGKSLLWHRQSYRMSDFDFNANKSDGYGVDWPIRYNDLADWYSYVEKFVGVSGNQDGLTQIPDGEFQLPFQLNQPELDLKATFKKTFPEYDLIMGRTAHLTQPTDIHLSLGRSTCQARNECHKGCSFGAYFSTLSATLPAAAKTDKLHLATNSVVHSLIYDEQKNRVLGIRVIDNEDLSTREYFANVVFLCASTLATTQIMLNTKTPKSPNGIANSSGALGHYLMDHNYSGTASGVLEQYGDEYATGRRPTGFIIPNVLFEPKRYANKFKRGYTIFGKARRKSWLKMRHDPGFGLEFKNKLTQAGPWGMDLRSAGEMLPRYENEVSLNTSKTDKWGMPQLHINCNWSQNEHDMIDHMVETSTKFLKAMGATDIKGGNHTTSTPPGATIHEVGTARMGRDPKTSVLNGFNQSHDIPNLFVTDGSAYPSIATVNPSLTFMALTVRAVDYCVKELKARRI